MQSPHQKQHHLLELLVPRQTGRKGTKHRSQSKFATPDYSTLTNVMGPHQHARRIRFLRRKTPRYPRYPAPEKGSVNHTSKQGEQKQQKAYQFNSITLTPCRVSYLCWDEPKYLNNIIEQDHRFIKKLTKQMKGFKTFISASATLDGIEVAHMIRKKPFGISTKTAFQQFAGLAG